MKKTSDPELVALIRRYRQAVAESDRLEREATAAEDRRQSPWRDLSAAMETRAVYASDGSIRRHRAFVYRGVVYQLEQLSGRGAGTGEARYRVFPIKVELLTD